MTTIWDGEEGGSMCAVCFCLLRRCVHRHWRGRIEVGCESSCESCFSERDLKILVWRWRYFSDLSPNLAPPAQVFSFRCIITLPLRAWCVRATPKKSLDFIVTSCLRMCERGGYCQVFLDLCSVCILYVCVFVPIRNWRQEQKFGPRSRLQRPISSILQHVFRRSLSLPVS